MPQWTVKLSISMSGGTAGSVTFRSRSVRPDPCDGDRRKEIDAEGLQLDVAVEPIFERRDDEFAERLGARAGGSGDGQHDQRAHDRGRHPRRGFEFHGILFSGDPGSGIRKPDPCSSMLPEP